MRYTVRELNILLGEYCREPGNWANDTGHFLFWLEKREAKEEERLVKAGYHDVENCCDCIEAERW